MAFKITRKSVFLIANIYIYIFRCTSVKRSCFVSEDVPCSLGHLKGSEHFLSPYDNTYILYLHLYIYIFGLTPLVGSAGPLGPPFHRSEGVKVTE